uniref:DUF4218 domain-containing protein n=1 Tax=Physcomitrium patens TaxID=3218 RepID=A0A2K1JV02_PHYPA|nr:hypothetical protein PHYPA_015129 [Physcomitrium patens]
MLNIWNFIDKLSIILHISQKKELLKNIALTFCILEKDFLLRLFDIMTHLMIYLTKDLFICGSVHC